MTHLLLAAFAVSLATSAAPVPEATRVEYQSKKTTLARGADAQVEMALWCESKGLVAERDNHLALALLRDPMHATARGLLGQVYHDGRWQKPEAVAESLKADADWIARRDAYEAKRVKTPNDAESQWKLATWCLDQGLKLEARAHLVAVVKLDPTRELAWKKLGYKKSGGRWVTPSNLGMERDEQLAQAEADRRWRPIFEQLRRRLKDPKTRASAEGELTTITDPRAVPSALRILLDGSQKDEVHAASLLSQIHSPASTRTLAVLAVAGGKPEARQIAMETLRRRDPREFIGSWIERVRRPIKYEVRYPNRPGESGVLFVQDDKTDLRREFQTLGFDFKPTELDRFYLDENGLPVVVRAVPLEPIRVASDRFMPNRIATVAGLLGTVAPFSNLEGWAGPQGDLEPVNFRLDRDLEGNGRPSGSRAGGRKILGQDVLLPVGEMQRDAERSRVAADLNMRQQVAEIDQLNDRIRKANDSALVALEDLTGQRHGQDPTAWRRWWTADQGYQFSMTQPDRVQTYETVPVGITPRGIPQISEIKTIGYVGHSCFGAGTLVQTRSGPKPIETLQAGDAILSQKATDGSLSFQPILQVFHNPPSDTLRITAGDETYVATGIHRFWKAGKGWTMARDLVAGDEIRTLSGKAKVESIRSDLKQPVYNLKVAEGNSYLIGKAGALVHDNSIVEPEDRSFDRIQK